MHAFWSGSCREPDPLPPNDWEAGGFCQYVAVFMLLYFGCVVVFMLSRGSFVQIYSSMRAAVKSCAKSPSLEGDPTPPWSFTLCSLLGALRRQVGHILRVLFSQQASQKLCKRLHPSLEQITPWGKLRRKQLRAGGRSRKHHVQYLNLVSGKFLYYLPLEHQHVAEAPENVLSYGRFNIVDVWKYKVGCRCLQWGSEQSAGTSTPSSATFEVTTGSSPRLFSPIHNHRRAQFT